MSTTTMDRHLLRRLGVDLDAEEADQRDRERAGWLAQIEQAEQAAAARRPALTAAVDTAREKVTAAEAVLREARQELVAAHGRLNASNGAASAACEQARRNLRQTACPAVAEAVAAVEARMAAIRKGGATAESVAEIERLIELRHKTNGFDDWLCMDDAAALAAIEESLRTTPAVVW